MTSETLVTVRSRESGIDGRVVRWFILSPTKAGVAQSIPGFGRVVCSGPVKGYEVLYTLDSVVG